MARVAIRHSSPHCLPLYPAFQALEILLQLPLSSRLVFENFTNLESRDKGYNAVDTPERDYIQEFHVQYPDKLIDARDLARWNEERPRRGRRRKKA
jgi:hypothetical protein